MYILYICYKIPVLTSSLIKYIFHFTMSRNLMHGFFSFYPKSCVTEKEIINIVKLIDSSLYSKSRKSKYTNNVLSSLMLSWILHNIGLSSVCLKSEKVKNNNY